MPFSQRGFTPSAVALAHFTLPQAGSGSGTGLELDLRLERTMARYLRLKYRVCVEDAIPDDDIRRGIDPMKTAYVVVEGPSDAEILRAVP